MYNLPTNDPFNEAFEQFQQTALFNRLQKKFAPLPYYLKFKPLKIVTMVASYIFNVFSAATAATLVFFFAKKMTGNVYVSGIITILFIAILEISKRLTASQLFKNKLQFGKTYFGLFAMVGVLTALSVVFSFYGSQRAVHTFTPPPKLIGLDTLTDYHTNQIALLNNQIEEARKTTYKGTTTRTSQRTIENLTNQINVLTSQKIALEDDARKENKSTEETAESQTEFNAYHFAIFTLFLEALFLMCAWYLEYYDFRSLSEFAVLQMSMNAPEEITENILPPPNDELSPKNNENLARARLKENDKELDTPLNGHEKGKLDEGIILKAIKAVKNEMTSAKYRLRNSIGIKQTNERNLKQAEKELQELDLKLEMVKG